MSKPKTATDKPAGASKVSAEEYAKNLRENRDGLAAVNIAFETNTSTAEALAFVQRNRSMFERMGADLVGDISISDAARTIHVVLSEEQRANAKKSRPKRNPTCKTVTVASMVHSRKQGVTLQDFLDSAAAGSVNSLKVTKEAAHGVERFVIDADDVAEANNLKRVALSTINEWWAQAGRTLTTD